MSDGESKGGAKKPLTEAQGAVLAFIEDRCRAEGMAPSYREIQEHFGYRAIGTVQDHMRALVKKGFLEGPRLGGPKRRARSLLPASFQQEGVRRIPIYGEIAAGFPREADQLELGSLVVAESALSQSSFALRVVGDSMIEAGILEGDFLLVEKTNRVTNGEIVVALVAGETTVKRYQVRADGPYLEPANARLKPMSLGGRKDWSIQGRVVGLQRVLK